MSNSFPLHTAQDTTCFGLEHVAESIDSSKSARESRSLEAGQLLAAHRRAQNRAWTLAFAVPVLSLLALTVGLNVAGADIAICRAFYDPLLGGWSYADSVFWQALYDWGPLPGLVLGIGGLVLWVLSLGLRPLRRIGEYGLFFAALLALGPGLLINGMLKPHSARPRPHQIEAFGGDQTFVGAWEIGCTADGKSFPCGHASMGFYLMAPAFLLYRTRRLLAVGFVALGLFGGTLIGLARIIEGDHFPSDVVWSAGVVYLSGLVLVVLLNRFSRFGGVPSSDAVNRSRTAHKLPVQQITEPDPQPRRLRRQQPRRTAA